MKTKRALNFIIDSICIQILASIMCYAAAYIAYKNNEVLEFNSESIILPTYFIYYGSLECLYNTTIGKIITKTRILSTNGEEPKIFQLIARTVLRILGPIDVISFLIKKDGTGFHDFFSKTKVVNTE